MCRNTTLGWCQCENDEWKGVQKGMWSAVMSPYETRYVDVKIDCEILGSVTVALKEGLFLPCQKMGNILLFFLTVTFLIFSANLSVL